MPTAHFLLPQAVLVHQLGKGVTQNPFRKNRGRVVRVLFHPTKPFFFVATQQNVSLACGAAAGLQRLQGEQQPDPPAFINPYSPIALHPYPPNPV